MYEFPVFNGDLLNRFTMVTKFTKVHIGIFSFRFNRYQKARKYTGISHSILYDIIIWEYYK